MRTVIITKSYGTVDDVIVADDAVARQASDFFLYTPYAGLL